MDNMWSESATITLSRDDLGVCVTDIVRGAVGDVPPTTSSSTERAAVH